MIGLKLLADETIVSFFAQAGYARKKLGYFVHSVPVYDTCARVHVCVCVCKVAKGVDVREERIQSLPPFTSGDLSGGRSREKEREREKKRERDRPPNSSYTTFQFSSRGPGERRAASILAASPPGN